MSKPDAALAQRLLSRDEEALREAIRLYGGLVNGMARRVLRDPALAEEVAQDAFVTLWRRPGAFDPERGSLKHFLASIARNKAIDMVRREESRKRTKESLLKETDPSDASAFERQIEDRSEVLSALSRLTPLQREVIVLAYFGGRSYREVAAEIGAPEGTVKTRMRDGLLKMRALVSDAREGVWHE